MSLCQRLRPLLAGVLLVLGGLSGCSSEQQSPSKRNQECCPCAPAQPVAPTARKLDQRLMAVLGAARGYHHQADLHLGRGDRDKAISALRALLALELDAKWPEAEEVRLDATARLAKLLTTADPDAKLVDAQGVDQAQKLVEAELARDPRESFYSANLHAVRGEVLEARVKLLDGAGKKEAAKEVAREAIASFERSIAINKRLQAKLPASAGKEAPR